MFNKHDVSRDACQLFGAQAKKGYDWWWHSFTAYNERTGEEKPFFIEFFTCNPALGGNAPIFGQLPENKAAGKYPSYLMVKAGAWGNEAVQLHRFFAWDDVEISMGVPYSIKADDCLATETELRGSIDIRQDESENHPEWMCGYGSVSWDLKIDKQIAYNVGYGAGALFRKLQLFEMFWHAEGMKSAFSGTITLNGERYIAVPEHSFGYADKNWGKDFTSPWVWISSCDLTSELTGRRLENSVFDIGGGCPKVGPVALPRKLLSAFWYEGRCFEFNFSKFWTRCRTEFDCKESDTEIIWHIDQSAGKGRMLVDLRCDKADMLFVNYEAPDGAKRHNRLWNGGNGHGTAQLWHKGKLIDRIHIEKAGCEYGEYD